MKRAEESEAWPEDPEAEALYLELLEAHESVSDEQLEALCASRPELELGLRRIHSLCARVDPMLGGAREDDSPPALERYAVVGELGRGGMGLVFEVEDQDLRRRLALKVARRADLASAEHDAGVRRRLARFLEETEVTGRLGHPGIVPVHERGVDEAGRPYFTMPLVQGTDLQRAMELARQEREGWTRARLLDALARVCETVAFAHSRGVVHRDLKPTNVMIGEFGEVYVLDWGLARDLERAERLGGGGAELESADSGLTLSGDVVGTPAYMSPEQAEGRVEEVGPATDVYAAGAMLYHLLAG